MFECEYSPDNYGLCGSQYGKTLFDPTSKTCTSPDAERERYCGEYKRISLELEKNRSGIISSWINNYRNAKEGLAKIIADFLKEEGF